MMMNEEVIIEYEYQRKLGNIIRVDTRQLKLFHVKELRIENGFLIVRHARKDVMLTGDYRTDVKSVGIKDYGSWHGQDGGAILDLVREEDIFKNTRFRLDKIKKLLF